MYVTAKPVQQYRPHGWSTQSCPTHHYSFLHNSREKNRIAVKLLFLVTLYFGGFVTPAQFPGAMRDMVKKGEAHGLNTLRVRMRAVSTPARLVAWVMRVFMEGWSMPRPAALRAARTVLW
ncbi:hypothetical protein E2C01_004388 [Portunus trituberculatus]|uniref:Uncharacterized protein n=1 Tax=Portunus trituberculatus TaxID=210409 RepID=A0A5B7CSV8_PORTR|nr:hypothetical protein [Portunus trituberculatus]